jgi:ribonucleoside-diphosphate reductase alpha chain
MRYGSKEALVFIDKVYKMIRDEAYRTSVEIAVEKGSFGKFDKKLFPQGKFIQELPKDLQKDIADKGIRNSLLLMQAPTGSTSLMANTTSGIEPVYEFEFIRRDRIGEHTVRHHLFEKWYNKHKADVDSGKLKRPDWFVSANDLTPEDHVLVQGVIQKYVDASISKTVNAPKTHTVEDVKRLYTLAYKVGCKGIAYMREGSRAGVLERKPEEKKEEVKPTPAYTYTPRPMMVEGVTYQTDTPVGKTYITINHDQNKEPFEVFITIGKSGSDISAMADALGRMISLSLRLNSTVPQRERVRSIVAQLIGIGGARTIGFGENRVRSFPDAIAKVLATHFGFRVNGVVEDKQKKEEVMQALNGNGNGNTHAVNTNVATTNGYAPITQEVSKVATQLPLAAQQPSGSFTSTSHFDICPECGDGTFVYEEGCKKCYGCGYSEC